MAFTHDDELLELEPLPEGEEAPPKYAHTMAIVRWIILGALSLFAVFMLISWAGFTPWAHAENSSVLYHCPMHPSYISNQPGECPICGMTLVPIDSTATVAPAKITQASSETQSAAPAAKPKPGQYYCPMDPQIISDSPGKCPICGMKLVKFEGDKADSLNPALHDTANKPSSTSTPGMPGMPGMDTSTVPGLVPVTIEPQRLQLIGLKTGMVAKRVMGGTVTAVGYVTADESRLKNINVRVSGWVKKLFIDQTGQSVSAGQPLLTIYSPDLFQAEQDLMTALEGAGHVPVDPELTAVRQQLVRAAQERLRLLGLSDAELANLEKNRKPESEITLTSRYEGVVLDRNVASGQYVTPDQNLLRLADLSKVWVMADIYENDLGSVKVGQTATVSLPSAGTAPLDGEVSFIYPVVSAETRTAKIRIELINPDMVLRPGMYANVSFGGESKPVLTVPAEAVMDGGKTKYAFVVHGGTHFAPTLITVGKESDDYAEILSGLKEGDEVVTSANFLIDSESRLKAAITGMGSAQTESHAGHTH